MCAYGIKNTAACTGERYNDDALHSERYALSVVFTWMLLSSVSSVLCNTFAKSCLLQHTRFEMHRVACSVMVHRHTYRRTQRPNKTRKIYKILLSSIHTIDLVLDKYIGIMCFTFWVRFQCPTESRFSVGQRSLRFDNQNEFEMYCNDRERYTCHGECTRTNCTFDYIRLGGRPKLYIFRLHLYITIDYNECIAQCNLILIYRN